MAKKHLNLAITNVAVIGGFQIKRRKTPMKKAKLLFGDNEPREEVKTRIPVWLYPSALEVVDQMVERGNWKSRSEYRGNAVTARF